MVFENVFSYLAFLIYIMIFGLIYIYLKRIISTRGFNGLSIFILSFALFYLIVPFLQTFFKLYRNDEAIFTKLLNLMTGEEIFFNFLLCTVFLIITIMSYNIKLNKKFSILPRNKIYFSKKNKNVNIESAVKKIADITLVVGVVSIILLIIEVGSLKTYLSFGSLTRGLDKDPTAYIRSSYLQIVTLSTVILVSPYLYFYLYKINKNKMMLAKLIVALSFSVLFLLYNQGRAPLILFFIPFIFALNKNRKKGFLGIGILSGVGLFLLSYLDALFNYLSYGIFYVEKKTNIITSFLGEFSYPFTNFSLRTQLVSYSDFRLFYDYIIWPFTMVPNFILKLVGINKESITSISNINTDIYGVMTTSKPTGGIPVDFLTFNYYQFGFISLIFACIVLGRVLKSLDKIFYFFKDDYAIKILFYRIFFSIINITNNADISAIIRNRLDVVVLLFIIILIYIKKKKQNEILRET